MDDSEVNCARYLFPKEFKKFDPTKNRLDQLIEMLPKEMEWELIKAKGHYYFSTYPTLKFYQKTITPEQALIQGVMHQHGLVWDSGAWVETNSRVSP